MSYSRNKITRMTNTLEEKQQCVNCFSFDLTEWFLRTPHNNFTFMFLHLFSPLNLQECKELFMALTVLNIFFEASGQLDWLHSVINIKLHLHQETHSPVFWGFCRERACMFNTSVVSDVWATRQVPPRRSFY